MAPIGSDYRRPTVVGYKTHKIEVLYRRDPLSSGNKTEGETMLLTLVTLNYAEYMCYNIRLQFLPMLSHSYLEIKVSMS